MNDTAPWPLPSAAVDRMVEQRGEVATRWLATVPALLDRAATAWHLGYDTTRPIENGFSSLVFPVVRGGQPAVLKLTPPWLNASAEITALSAWGERGRAPAVLGCSRTAGVLLLERVLPGDRFQPRGGVSEYRAVADLIGGLNIPVAELAGTDGLQSLTAIIDRRTDRELRQVEDANRRYLPDFHRAVAAAKGMVAETRPEDMVLLHGDAHPQNLIRGAAGRNYAIDPEAAIGDRHYDVANYAVVHRNVEGVDRAVAVMSQRLGLDESRVWKFAGFIAATEMLHTPPDLAKKLHGVVERSLQAHRPARGVA